MAVPWDVNVIADANSSPFHGWVQTVAGATFAAGRAFGFICSSPGLATVTFTDGSQLTLPIFVNGGALQTLPYAITKIVLSGGAGATLLGVFV